MTIEATSVVMDRDGRPTVAIVAGLRPDGTRGLANSRDADVMDAMTRDAWEGRVVTVSHDGTSNHLI
jgi:hypothetical protein